MAETLTTTINYSGMLYTKTDESTRFLDAVYSRGKNGGRTTSYSTEFVLSSGYAMEEPTQPAISESASMTAPTPETTERTQETNVCQIFQKSVRVSYMKQSNRDALGGLNIAGANNNVPNELDFQIGRRVAQARLDLNYTLINGVYQYTKGSTTVAPKTRGLMTAITTNKFDATGKELDKNLINDAIMNSIKNGASAENMEIWVNPDMIDPITDAYLNIKGSALPPTRDVGGVAYSSIMTPYGMMTIFWEPVVPTGNILLVNMGQMAVAEKPYTNERGESMGVLFYEPLAKTGAAESGQLYAELGCDYGAEWQHALITNIG